MLSTRSGIFAGAALLILSACGDSPEVDTKPNNHARVEQTTSNAQPVTVYNGPHIHGATRHGHQYTDPDHRHLGISEIWHGSGYDPKPGRAPAPKNGRLGFPNPLDTIRRGVEDGCQDASRYRGRDGGCTERGTAILGAILPILVR